MRFEVTTLASPEQVREALTDFTDRRLQIWNRTLDPKTYQVRALGDTWAVAHESTAGSPFWVVSRYDWADPTVVRWTIAPRDRSTPTMAGWCWDRMTLCRPVLGGSWWRAPLVRARPPWLRRLAKCWACRM